jgi:hypothetical protein
VSVTFIQDGTDSFEDWLDKKYLDIGFNAPSLSNTWTVRDHMLSVIATKRYIQTVKENSPINGSLSDSDDDSYPPRSSKKSTISREVSVQEKKFIDTLPKCLPCHQGFSKVDAKNAQTDRTKCLCPCSKALARCWVEKYQVHFDSQGCQNKIFTSKGLMDHLRVNGGVHMGQFL